jgi:hypothetical protein
MHPVNEFSTDLEKPLVVPVELPHQQLRRGLAIVQQVKDSITIVMMLSTGMLVFGILFGVAIPGLVLYALRWKLVPRGTNRVGGWLWVLTLVHEFVWAAIFCSAHPQHDALMPEHYEVGYLVGVAISLLALVAGAWPTTSNAATDEYVR